MGDGDGGDKAGLGLELDGGLRDEAKDGEEEEDEAVDITAEGGCWTGFGRYGTGWLIWCRESDDTFRGSLGCEDGQPVRAVE